MRPRICFLPHFAMGMTIDDDRQIIEVEEREVVHAPNQYRRVVSCYEVLYRTAFPECTRTHLLLTVISSVKRAVLCYRSLQPLLTR